jgi:hypothetical protein
LKAFKNELPPYDNEYDEVRSPPVVSGNERLELFTPEDDNVNKQSSMTEATHYELSTVTDAEKKGFLSIFNAGKNIITAGNSEGVSTPVASPFIDEKSADKMPALNDTAPTINLSINNSNVEKKFPLVGNVTKKVSTVIETSDSVVSAITTARKNIVPIGTSNTTSDQKNLKDNLSGDEDDEDGGVRLGVN